MGLFGFDSIADMFDGGGPGASGRSGGGGSSGGGSDGGGGYTSIADMFDGGGPGQSGPEFGGMLGGVSNALGFSPADPGDRAGGIYSGPNIDGSAGYYQDPGVMGVDPVTGYLTSDDNAFRPAPAVSESSILDLINSGGGEGPPAIATGNPPPAAGDTPPAAGNPPPSAGPVSPYVPYVPATFTPMPPPTAAVASPSQFTFDQYLERFNAVPRNLGAPTVTPLSLGALPQVQPLQLPPLNQGIGSLPPASPPRMGPPVGINPPVQPPILPPILHFDRNNQPEQPVFGGRMG